MNILVTDRCTLEPQIAAHADEMFIVLSDPAIYEFENAPPQSEAWLRSRFEKLETRTSPDGREHWLNWVIRLPDRQLAGYVQATVLESGIAYVAYELASRCWRKGLGSHAVSTMLCELASKYDVAIAVAVLKSRNFRSHGLLLKLGFVAADVISAGLNSVDIAALRAVIPEPDEIVMAKLLAP